MRVILGFLLAAIAWGAEPPKPKFKLGKDTTFITEPLDADGYLDYETALNEHLRGKITPETNAVVLLWQALGPKPEGKGMPADYWAWLGVKPPAADGDYFGRLDAFIKAKTGKPGGEKLWDAEGVVVRRPWRREDYPLIAGWLEDNERPLQLVREAAARPAFFSPVVGRDTKGGRTGLVGASAIGLTGVREVVKALCARAMWRLGEKDPDAAWQDLRTAHRLARLMGNSGLIDALIGLASEGIVAWADVPLLAATTDKDRIRGCRKDLDGLPPFAPHADRVTFAERLLFLDLVQGVRRTAAKADAKARAAIEAQDWEGTLRSVNARFDEIATALRRPARADRIHELKQIEDAAKLPKMEAGEVLGMAFSLQSPEDVAKFGLDRIEELLIRVHLPAFEKMQESLDRLEQGHRNLRVAFALAAYRAEHGDYPKELADLTPAFLAKVPDDLFAGKPLTYKPRKNGYLLYSLGVNGKDDRGKTYGDSPFGSDDLTVRMPPAK